jgi:5-formyltetrahydrofolate cyclo-ligase
MSTSKSKLREQLKKQRQSLSAQEAKEFSQEIIKSCTKILNMLSIRNVHIYLPLEKYNEVDTWPLARYIWQNHPHIKTATWQKTQDGQFLPVLVDSKTQFITDEGGLCQPKNATSLPPDIKYDVIVAPLLGFDDHGHRLGYGDGFYDRFLITQEAAQTVGLCYEFGHLKTLIPFESHDIPLKTIITEKEIYNYKSRR